MKVKIPKDETKAKILVESHDLYALDQTIALIVLPLLKAFRKATDVIPESMYSEESRACREISKTVQKREDKAALKKWYETLDKMIWSFNEIAVDAPLLGTEQARTVHEINVQVGLDLFAKHFTDLWV